MTDIAMVTAVLFFRVWVGKLLRVDIEHGRCSRQVKKYTGGGRGGAGEGRRRREEKGGGGRREEGGDWSYAQSLSSSVESVEDCSWSYCPLKALGSLKKFIFFLT